MKPAPPTCFEAHEKEREAHEKKAKKKKLLVEQEAVLQACPSVVGRNVPRHPFFVFFPHEKSLSLVHFFININNETLVWSEKDGGSAFAGGNDGQGDKLRALFSLFSLHTLRGGVSRVSILSSRISLLIFPTDKKIVLSLLYLLNSWTRAQHRSTKRSNKSISNWRSRGNRLRKSDPVLRKMR